MENDRLLGSATKRGSATSQDAPSAKRLKPSDVISCSECRRRKMKCSKETPCQACIARGKPDECRPDSRKYPASFTSVSADVQHFRRRQEAVERYLLHRDGEDFTAWMASAVNDRRSDTPNGEHDAQAFIAARDDHDSQSLITGGEREDPRDQELVDILSLLQDYDMFRKIEAQPAISANLPGAGLETSITYLSADVSKREPWQQQLHLTLLSCIPDKDTIDQLVDAYFKKYGWHIPVLFRPQITMELEEFDRLRAFGRQAEVDPAWLAILFTVFALGLISRWELQQRQTTLSDQDAQTVIHTANRFLKNGLGALTVSDHLHVASLRVLQSLILHRHYVHATPIYPENPNCQQPSHTHFVSLANFHCHSLGLDQLGTDPKLMPNLDPSLPKVACGLRRQLALRIFYSYMALECMSMYICGEPKPYTGALPATCRDSDLGWSLNVTERTLKEVPDQILPIMLAQLTLHSRDFLIQRLKNGGSLSSVQADALEADLAKKFVTLRVQLGHVKGAELAAVFGDQSAALIYLNYLQGGATMRLQRAAMKRNLFHEADGRLGKHYRRAVEVAQQIVELTPRVSIELLCMTWPKPCLLIVSACVVLTIYVGDDRVAESKTSLRKCLKSGLEYLRHTLAVDRRPRVAIGAQKGLESLDRLVQFLRRTSTTAKSPLDDIYASTDAAPAHVPPPTSDLLAGRVSNQIADPQLSDFATAGIDNNQMQLPAFSGSLDNILYSGLSFDDVDLDSWLASL